ncbi:MAG: hypothetical protein ACI9JN_002209 [Bacteroidia bacterium]
MIKELLNDIINYSACGVLLYLFFLAIRSNKEYFFIEIAVFFALIQWVLAPAFMETIEIEGFKPFQLITNARIISYFSYSISSFIVLFMALFLFLRKKKNVVVRRVLDEMKSPEQQGFNGKIGIIYIVVGAISSLIFALFNIPVISVILSFLWNLIPVGIIHVIYSRIRGQFIILTLGIIYFLSIGVKTGLFFQTMIWLGIIAIFAFLKYKFPTILKLSFLILAIPGVLILQVAKHEYREKTWGDKEITGSKSLLLISELKETALNIDFKESSKYTFLPIALRMNQAHIDGKVMKNIPKRKPFQNGKTISKSFLSVFVPRPLWPGKYTYGNEKMLDLANHKLGKNAFFTVSIMGESYANFGLKGGVAFLCIFLFILKALYVRIIGQNYGRVYLLFFSPAIFYTVIRTEIDFYQIFANLIISYILFTFIAKATSRIYNQST